MFPAAFLPFIEKRPIGVMARAIVERFFEPTHLDDLFRRTAVKQVERNLLFSSVVDLMQGVVLGVEPSVFAAYSKRQKTFPVSDRQPTTNSRALNWACRRPWFTAEANTPPRRPAHLQARRAPWRWRAIACIILDGNAPAATEHRLEPLRDTWAARRCPGKILVGHGSGTWRGLRCVSDARRPRSRDVAARRGLGDDSGERLVDRRPQLLHAQILVRNRRKSGRFLDSAARHD